MNLTMKTSDLTINLPDQTSAEYRYARETRDAVLRQEREALRARLAYVEAQLTEPWPQPSRPPGRDAKIEPVVST